MNLDAPQKLARTLKFYYDKDWLGWDPEVLEATLRQKFDANPSEEQLERVEATREVIRADRFAFEPLIFENVTRAFCGLPLSGDVWQPVDAAQMAYGLYAMRQLVGKGPLQPNAMGDQVTGYMATVLAREPLPVPTEWFGFHPAEEDLRRLLHVPEITTRTEAVWEGVMADPPVGPNQLYRDIKVQFQPEEDLSGDEESVYRHAIRLASIWADLHRREAAPKENPFE